MDSDELLASICEATGVADGSEVVVDRLDSQSFTLVETKKSGERIVRNGTYGWRNGSFCVSGGDAAPELNLDQLRAYDKLKGLIESAMRDRAGAGPMLTIGVLDDHPDLFRPGYRNSNVFGAIRDGLAPALQLLSEELKADGHKLVAGGYPNQPWELILVMARKRT